MRATSPVAPYVVAASVLIAAMRAAAAATAADFGVLLLRRHVVEAVADWGRARTVQLV